MGTRPNGNVLLGVSLPNHAMRDESVTDLVKKYRRAYLILTVCFLILIIPVFFLAEYFSLAQAYSLLWGIIFLCLDLKIISTYVTRMYSLKIEKQWQVGSQHVISIDTKVSRLKHTFMLPLKWFFLPLSIATIPIIGSFFKQYEESSWTTIITSFVMVAILFSVYLGIGKMRTKTYSENTEINLYLNYMFKSVVSKFLIFLTTFLNLFLVVILYLPETPEVEVIAVTIFSLTVIIVSVLSYNKVRSERNKLLQVTDEDFIHDEDQYWIGGIFYNNPNDRTIFIEKRIGFGMTVNIGTWGGKLILAGITLMLVYAIASTIWVIFGS